MCVDQASRYSFPRRKAGTYHIMVASPSSDSGGWEFDKLSWEKVEGSGSSNDMFEFANVLTDDQNGSQFVSTGGGASVEPDEPMESGIQTRWWKWRAPAAGTFTWYWNEATLDVAVFFRQFVFHN